MIVKHKRFAVMSLTSDEIRDMAAEVSADVQRSGENPTTVIHYPDGRIEVDAAGDAQAFADIINQSGGYPDNVQVVE